MERRRFVLSDAHGAIERLALPMAEQVEWVSRRRLDAHELLDSHTLLLRRALILLGEEFSPVLRLRIEAIANELDSVRGDPSSAQATAEAVLSHSNWAVARHLAEGSLRDPGWPRP